MKKEITYEAAMTQLEDIVNHLENNALGIDSLSEQLAKAQELITFCKERLKHVETDVKKILENGQG